MVVYVPLLKATVTVTVASFILPALSVARARIVVLPWVVTTSEADQVDQSPLPPGPVAVAAFNGLEPTFTSTFWIPLPPELSDAVPATLTVTPVEGPDTVLPSAGELIATEGAVVSPEEDPSNLDQSPAKSALL